MNLKGKKILVTGHSGMVGQQLVDLLLTKEAEITGVSLDHPDRFKNKGVKFIHGDLREFSFCKEITNGQDVIFNLVGCKGSPRLTKTKPASFLTNMLQFNTNMIEASRQNKVGYFCYVSSVGTYGESELFKEDDMWKNPCSPADFHAGMAKRIGELQLEAIKIEYPDFKYSIVRPSNIHGAGDDFSGNGMVIPSLIKRALESSGTLEVWGSGSCIRDFINSYDVARALIFCVENEIGFPVNIGSGSGITIKQLVETIVKYIPNKLEIKWLTNMPEGDKIRISDMSRLFSYGFKLEKTLDQSIKETIDWYINNKDDVNKRYDVFKSN